MKFIILLTLCLTVVACSGDQDLTEYKLNGVPSDSASIEKIERDLSLWVGEYLGTCDKLSPEQKALRSESFQLTILTGEKLSVSYSNRRLFHVSITLPKEPNKFDELTLSEKTIKVSTVGHSPKEKLNIERVNNPIGEEMLKGTVLFYIRKPDGKSKEAFRLIFTARMTDSMQQETTRDQPTIKSSEPRVLGPLI